MQIRGEKLKLELDFKCEINYNAQIMLIYYKHGTRPSLTSQLTVYFIKK